MASTRIIEDIILVLLSLETFSLWSSLLVILVRGGSGGQEDVVVDGSGGQY